MVRERSTYIGNELLNTGHIRERVHMEVLVICKNEHNIGSLRSRPWWLCTQYFPVPTSVKQRAGYNEGEQSTERQHCLRSPESLSGSSLLLVAWW